MTWNLKNNSNFYQRQSWENERSFIYQMASPSIKAVQLILVKLLERLSVSQDLYYVLDKVYLMFTRTMSTFI